MPQNTHLDMAEVEAARLAEEDRKSTRLNSSHSQISYAVFCLKQKKRATAILRKRIPINGSFSSVASMAIRPLGVPYHTFSITAIPTKTARVKKPKMLPTKWLT